MSKQHYAALKAPAWHPYLAPPPRCPVHGGYMRFRYTMDMFICRPGCRYYVTASSWQRCLAGETGLAPGWFAPWTVTELARVRAPIPPEAGQIRRKKRKKRKKLS